MAFYEWKVSFSLISPIIFSLRSSSVKGYFSIEGFNSFMSRNFVICDKVDLWDFHFPKNKCQGTCCVTYLLLVLIPLLSAGLLVPGCPPLGYIGLSSVWNLNQNFHYFPGRWIRKMKEILGQKVLLENCERILLFKFVIERGKDLLMCDKSDFLRLSLNFFDIRKSCVMLTESDWLT